MPTNTAIIGIMRTISCPYSQPSDLLSSCMLAGVGNGGRCAPRMKMVYMHQTISMTTITVVTCMIFSALSLDSWTTLIFSHQKNTVTRTAKNAAVELSDRTIPV